MHMVGKVYLTKGKKRKPGRRRKRGWEERRGQAGAGGGAERGEESKERGRRGESRGLGRTVRKMKQISLPSRPAFDFVRPQAQPCLEMEAVRFVLVF